MRIGVPVAPRDGVQAPFDVEREQLLFVESLWRLLEVAFAEEGDTVTVTGAWYPAGNSFFACELGPRGPWPRPNASGGA